MVGRNLAIGFCALFAGFLSGCAEGTPEGDDRVGETEEALSESLPSGAKTVFAFLMMLSDGAAKMQESKWGNFTKTVTDGSSSRNWSYKYAAHRTDYYAYYYGYTGSVCSRSRVDGGAWSAYTCVTVR